MTTHARDLFSTIIMVGALVCLLDDPIPPAVAETLTISFIGPLSPPGYSRSASLKMCTNDQVANCRKRYSDCIRATGTTMKPSKACPEMYAACLTACGGSRRGGYN